MLLHYKYDYELLIKIGFKMNSNVVLFPKGKKNHPPQTVDDIIDAVEENRKDHIEAFMESVLPFIFSNAFDFGLDLSKPECSKSTALFIESFKSALYDVYDLDHPLHELSEQIFKTLEDNYNLAVETDITEDKLGV